MSNLRSFMAMAFAGAIVFAGLLSVAPASAHGVKAQIIEMEKSWVAAFKNRDFAAIEAIYAPDGLLLTTNNPPIEGAAVIAEVWKSWADLPNVEINFAPNRLEVSASGDMVSDYGWYTFAFDTENGRFEDKGKYMVLWKKIDGKWKVSSDIFNTNLPAE